MIKIIFIMKLCCVLAMLQICQGANEIILSDIQPETSEEEVITHDIKYTETFIPTHEWQIVKPNQAVPAGLHIRMNFQTGIKEAKILDKEEGADNSDKKSDGSSDDKSHSLNEGEKTPKIIIGEEVKQDSPGRDDKIYFTKNHIKEALHNFRDKVGNKDVIDDITWSDDAKQAISDEQIVQQTVKKKFRSIEEIKAELEDTMFMKIRSETELIQELVPYITSTNSSDIEKGAALDNLEYYVHQIDNARNLNKVGGLEPVIILLNNTNEYLQERAAKVIGAAAQSNKEVQDDILHYGGLRLILQMLNPGKKSLTKKMGLYALSAVVRGNTAAQQQLVELNGIKNILLIVKDETMVTSLRVKGVTMLYDLIVEQNDIMNKLIENGKMKNRERSPLLNLLIESDWCHMLVPLLDTKDFDTKEKVIHAISVSVDACKDTLKEMEGFKDVLKEELSKLKVDIKNEEDNDFILFLESLKKELEINIIKKLES